MPRLEPWQFAGCRGADETAWGNPRITKALINQIAAQGYKSIRIPVTWNNHIGNGPNYTIDAAYMDRVQEVVDWALKADLYVMINVHHDSWLWISHMENNRNEVVAKYNAVWTQVAHRFRNHSNKLMFESVNEPRFSDGGTTDEKKAFQMLDELHVSFHQIVRGSGARNATRPLVLSTLEASPTQERMNELYNTMTKLNDTNLIATVHYYGFWPFSVNIAGYTVLRRIPGTISIKHSTMCIIPLSPEGFPSSWVNMDCLGSIRVRESLSRGETEVLRVSNLLSQREEHYPYAMGQWPTL